MASRLEKRCRAKFKKLARLNADIDEGGAAAGAARKAKARMPDSWVKRTTTNVQGYHKSKNAKAGVCTTTKL